MGLALHGCMPLAIVLLPVLNQLVLNRAAKGMARQAGHDMAGPGRLDYVMLCLQGRF